MDPASLGIVLNGIVTITSIIQQKIDKLNRISNQEMTSAGQYSKALVVLSNDLKGVTTKLNTITLHGNKAAATALLNTTDGGIRLIVSSMHSILPMICSRRRSGLLML